MIYMNHYLLLLEILYEDFKLIFLSMCIFYKVNLLQNSINQDLMQNKMLKLILQRMVFLKFNQNLKFQHFYYHLIYVFFLI